MLLLDVIGGFKQSEEHANGCVELREKLLSNLDDFSALSVRVRFHEWNERFRTVARNAHLLRLRYPKPEPFGIVVFAFSWGVGNGLVQYAKALSRFGLKIQCAVLCDGIYRHWYPGGNWRAVVGGYRITLPPNVLTYYGFHQEISRPMGVKPVGEATCLGWEKLDYEHVEMDDSPEWHDRCIRTALEEVKSYVAGKVPLEAPRSSAVESRLLRA